MWEFTRKTNHNFTSISITVHGWDRPAQIYFTRPFLFGIYHMDMVETPDFHPILAHILEAIFFSCASQSFPLQILLKYSDR